MSRLAEKHFRYQLEMEAYINDTEAAVPACWQPCYRINTKRAGEIYRRNLYAGVRSGLANSFKVSRRYIGDPGFTRLCTEFISRRPQTSPVFRTLAAHFPEFVGNADLPAALRQCLKALTTLDFLMLGVSPVSVPMDKRFLVLYQLTHEYKKTHGYEGLYRIPDLHPQTIFSKTEDKGAVSVRYPDGTPELWFRKGESH